MKLYFAFIFTIFSVGCFSQNKYDFSGVLKLNGDDKTLITYNVEFTVINGIIKGHSRTDLGGLHETKSVLTGFYNTATKTFSFSESQILYTKSAIPQKDFCFVFFEGNLKLSDKLQEIKGAFTSKYKDGKKCINGTLLLINQKKIAKTVTKISNKIQSSKKLDSVTKKKFNLQNMADSLRVNSLLKNQNLSIFATSKKVVIEIWDNKKEDGDAINLYQNAKVLLKDYTVLNKKKLIEIPVTNEPIVIKLEATSEGEYAPNTAMIRVIDGENTYELLSKLKKWETSTITIHN